MKEKAKTSHSQRFGALPDCCVFAPGRVNFIGEHTDYNGGLVMPLALQMGVTVAASKNRSGLLRIQSVDFDKYGEFPLENLSPDKEADWANCPKGIIRMMLDKGLPVGGLDITITGNLPIGAGLSSSAAVEVATGLAAATLFGIDIDRTELALLAQKAEHAFTGTQCGIMDMMISARGRKDHLMILSCHDLKIEYAPFNLGNAALLVVNSRVKHNLADSEYNTRRRECAEALALARKDMPYLKTLSDYPLDQLVSGKEQYPPVLYKRFHHVLSENNRVRKTADALAKNNMALAGALLLDSHSSLRDDYEVSCVELDWLVDSARGVKGVYGARMTGGGFGGCVIVLLEKTAVAVYRESLNGYSRKFGITPEIYEALPGNGARVV